jgi:cbb3-type cytochrome oxidase subunit 3
MAGFLQWFTHLENSKVFALVLFFALFCAILIYLYSSKKRSERLESYKNIPFEDEEHEEYTGSDDKVSKNE